MAAGVNGPAHHPGRESVLGRAGARSSCSHKLKQQLSWTSAHQQYHRHDIDQILPTEHVHDSMSSQPLHALWEASAGQPFQAAVDKDTQLSIGFFLLLGAIILTGLFGLSMWHGTAGPYVY